MFGVRSLLVLEKSAVDKKRLSHPVITTIDAMITALNSHMV